MNYVPDTWGGSPSALAWARDMANDTSDDYIFFCLTDYPMEFGQPADIYAFIQGDISNDEGVISVENAKLTTFQDNYIVRSSPEDVTFTFNGYLCYTSLCDDQYPSLINEFDTKMEGGLLYALLISSIISFLYTSCYHVLKMGRRGSD